eukprot:3773082-Pleurochrysis_carterae.AAC.9
MVCMQEQVPACAERYPHTTRGTHSTDISGHGSAMPRLGTAQAKAQERMQHRFNVRQCKSPSATAGVDKTNRRRAAPLKSASSKIAPVKSAPCASIFCIMTLPINLAFLNEVPCARAHAMRPPSTVTPSIRSRDRSARSKKESTIDARAQRTPRKKLSLKLTSSILTA